MQRAKVGLLGLATVILLIAFASAIMRTVTRESPVTAVGAPRTDVVANMVAPAGKGDSAEPIAELGVAPATNSQQMPTAPRR